MSDLFFRIAERAMGLAPTLQPMVTPFFAPTQQQEGNDLFFETLDETEREEQRPAGTTTQQDADEPAPDRKPVHLPELPPRSNDAYAPQQHAPAPASAVRPHHARESEQPLYPEQMRREQAFAYPNTEYRPVPAYPSLPAPEYPSPTPAYLHEPLHRPLEARPLPYTPRFTGSGPVDGEGAHGAGAAHPGDDKAARASILEQTGADTLTRISGTVELAGATGTRPRATPQQNERRTNEAVPERTQATPTVHVTIGRIEVRATLAPTSSQTQAQRQQAAPKTMSLDEYLKQSGKGGRR